jgi:hypothetical protein
MVWLAAKAGLIATRRATNVYFIWTVTFMCQFHSDQKELRHATPRFALHAIREPSQSSRDYERALPSDQCLFSAAYGAGFRKMVRFGAAMTEIERLESSFEAKTKQLHQLLKL